MVGGEVQLRVKHADSHVTQVTKWYLCHRQTWQLGHMGKGADVFAEPPSSLQAYLERSVKTKHVCCIFTSRCSVVQRKNTVATGTKLTKSDNVVADFLPKNQPSRSDFLTKKTRLMLPSNGFDSFVSENDRVKYSLRGWRKDQNGELCLRTVLGSCTYHLCKKCFEAFRPCTGLSTANLGLCMQETPESLTRAGLHRFIHKTCQFATSNKPAFQQNQTSGSVIGRLTVDEACGLRSPVLLGISSLVVFLAPSVTVSMGRPGATFPLNTHPHNIRFTRNLNLKLQHARITKLIAEFNMAKSMDKVLKMK